MNRPLKFVFIPNDIQVISDIPVLVSYHKAETSGGRRVIVTYSHVSGSIFPLGNTTVGITATSKDGQQVFAQFIIRVNPSPVLNPVIDSLSPDSDIVGANIGIIGSEFGLVQGASTVTLNGVPAIVTSWTPNSIIIEVPDTTTGLVVVTVGGIASNGVLFTVIVTPPPVVIDIVTTSPLLDGNVGTQYSLQFQASGGTFPYTFESTGPLPSGMNLSTSGLYTGVPDTIQDTIFPVMVTDSLGNFIEENFSHSIEAALSGPLEFLTASIPSGVVNQFYSVQFQGEGGTPPYAFSLFSGSLPPGISFVGSSIQGTPTASGIFNFRVKLQDSIGTQVFRDFSLQIIAIPIQITNNSPLPTASEDNPYALTFNIIGGTLPYTLAKISGNFPTGLSLSGLTLSGTPPNSETQIFTLRATDSLGASVNKQFSLTVSLEGPHSYFDNLAGRADVLSGPLTNHNGITYPNIKRAWSLRPQTGQPITSPHYGLQLNFKSQGGFQRISPSNNTPTIRFVTYNPSGDTDPNAQDAAKVILPQFRLADACSLRNTIGTSDGFIDFTPSPSFGGEIGRAVKLDNEILLITRPPGGGPQTVGTTIYMTRGAYGTLPVSHLAGTVPEFSSNSLSTAIQVPVQTDGTIIATYLFTWDYFITDSYMHADDFDTSHNAHKTFQITGGESFLGAIWAEPRHKANGTSGKGTVVPGYNPDIHVAGFDMRGYNYRCGVGPGTPCAVTDWNLTNSYTLGQNAIGTGDGTGQAIRYKAGFGTPGEFLAFPNRWIRIWVVVKVRPTDYDLISYYICDEQQDTVTIFEDLMVSIRARPDNIGGNPPQYPKAMRSWWIELDESFNGVTRADYHDWVFYVRNFVALKNPPDIASLITVKPLG